MQFPCGGICLSVVGMVDVKSWSDCADSGSASARHQAIVRASRSRCFLQFVVAITRRIPFQTLEESFEVASLRRVRHPADPPRARNNECDEGIIECQLPPSRGYRPSEPLAEFLMPTAVHLVSISEETTTPRSARNQFNVPIAGNEDVPDVFHSEAVTIMAGVPICSFLHGRTA